jgi:integrase
MEKYSARIRIKKDHIRKDGTSQVYLQVIINSRIEKINLELSWPPNRFSEERYCLPREKKDTTANDYNMILRSAVAKANDIFTNYRLADVPLSPADFRREYNTQLNKTDFVLYMEQKIEERLRRRAITLLTARMHRATLASLREFSTELPFNQFTTKFPEDFSLYLEKKRLNNANTIWGRHKVVKTYLAMAAEEHIKFLNPYAKFSNRTVSGKWKAMNREELHKLMAHYETLPLTNAHRRVLQRFLFSCFTGLRLSDLKRLRREWVYDGALHFVPFKTRRFDKEMKLPLSAVALKILEEAFSEDSENTTPFARFTDQYCNRVIKDIGTALEIRTTLHTHVGRETFATLYLAMGGNVEVLQKYLGHSDIATTMRYVHVDHERQAEEMHRMDLLAAKKEGPAE